MRRVFIALCLGAAALTAAQLLYPGCATMVHGSKQAVWVKSKPTGAQVFIDGKRLGPTPATAYLSRWGSHRVRVEMAGYQPYEVTLVKRGNDNVTGNVFLGVAPIFVDVVSGAVFTLDVPDEVKRAKPELQFPARDRYPMSQWDALTVFAVLKPDPAWKKIGQLQRRAGP